MIHSIISHNRKKWIYLTKILIILFWIFVWQIASCIIGQDLLFAGPIAVIYSLALLVGKNAFWLSIGFSMGKISIGFGLAFCFAFFLGMLSYFFHFLRELLKPIILLMKSIPIASFIVLALVWMNSKNLSIFISFFVVFPTIYIGITEGLEQTNKELLEMAYVYRMKFLKKIRYIYLLDAFPFLIHASKIALGMCWKAGIAAEIIGTPKNSIGEHLYMAKIYLSTSDLFAWTFVIILLSLFFEKIVIFLLEQIRKRLECGT